MTLKELQKEINLLVKAGHGDLLMIKSRDEEGNGFEEISSLEVSSAIGEGYNLEVKHPDDIAEYDPSELKSVICIW